MAKPFDFSTALMVPRDMGPKAKARADQAAIEKRRRELIDEKQTMDARKEEQAQNERRRQGYKAIDQMQFAPQNPIQYKHSVPAVELSQAPLQPGTEMATGGPEGKPAPWANDPVVEDDAPPAAPATATAKPWESDPVIEDDQPARDPLAPKGGPALPPRERDLFDKAQAGEIQNEPDKPWNEQLADMLGKGVDFLMEPINSRDAGPNDPVKTLSKGMVEPLARLPEALARDPNQAVQDYDPFHQIGRGYNNLVDAGGDVLEGNLATAGPKALQGTTEALGGALGLMGFKGGPKAPTPLGATSLGQAERMAAKASNPSVVAQPGSMREPSVRETGKTLAAVAVPGRQLRPQALQAFTRILSNSNVPADRIASGLARIVEGLKSPVDSKTGRAPSIALLLKREFGPEFPEVVTNIDLVRLERRLSKKAGDASPTIVREAVKDLRGSQASYLTDSATRNAGATTRNATRKDMEATLSEFGEEGYNPILAQPIDAARAETIQGVLTGPGMGELGKPLRQIAAGEGKTIEGMIQESPLEAAHWMQHKARLLAEENGGTTLGNAYTSMRNRILATIDDLKTPDGQTYKQLRTDFAETAKIGKDLKVADQFGALVKNPEKATTFVENFKAATPAQQEAQLSSIGDWVLSKVRGGGEEAAARIAEMQNIAVLDTLDKLGPKGKALADDIRAIRDEEIDLQAFYPKAESQTASNQVALAEGPDVYSRNAKGSAGMTVAADGTLMAAGATHAPLLTALRQGPKIYRGMMQPKTATREDMTRLLMARPGARPKGETVAPPPAAPTRTIPPKGPDQWFHSGTIAPGDAVDVTRGELGFHVGSKQSAEVRAKDWPSQKQTLGEYDVQGNFTRVPDMGQWGPDDYLTARRRSSTFDESLEPMWKELDALAKRDPGRKEWTAAVQDAAKRNGISGWEYKNAQEGGGMSRIIMDPQAVGAKAAAPSSPSSVTPIKPAPKPTPPKAEAPSQGGAMAAPPQGQVRVYRGVRAKNSGDGSNAFYTTNPDVARRYSDNGEIEAFNLDASEFSEFDAARGTPKTADVYGTRESAKPGAIFNNVGDLEIGAGKTVYNPVTDKQFYVSDPKRLTKVSPSKPPTRQGFGSSKLPMDEGARMRVDSTSERLAQAFDQDGVFDDVLDELAKDKSIDKAGWLAIYERMFGSADGVVGSRADIIDTLRRERIINVRQRKARVVLSGSEFQPYKLPPSQSGSSKLLAGVTGLGGIGVLSAAATLDKDEARKKRKN